MAEGGNPKGGDYEVGYGRPPNTTQFAPGKSGNPRGRPKGSRSIGASLNDALSRRVTVTGHGKPRRVSGLDAMLQRAVSDALRGDKAALKLILSLAERYGESSESALNIEEMQEEDRAILARYAIPTVGTFEPEDASPGELQGGEPQETEGDDGGPV